MKVLYISRNPKMGFSIGKVFAPIIKAMHEKAEVESIELPCANYSLKSLWINIKTARRAIQKNTYDIVHITGSEHYLLPFINARHIVVTVHDLGFFTNLRITPRTLLKYLLWIRTLKYADYVTFISSKSEKEALNLVRLKDNKHSVVFNPIGTEFHYAPKSINTEFPTILHIGIKPNKNLNTTAIALNGYPCKLRIVGKIDDNTKTILDLNKINYENVSNLTDQELLQEYINCDYVNFPSLYEGFGMPIIEGQAVGRPILTSNLSPMKEIAGNAAVLINPSDPEAIRNGYNYLSTHVDDLIQKGLVNVQRFQLNKVVEDYYNIYKSLL